MASRPADDKKLAKTILEAGKTIIDTNKTIPGQEFSSSTATEISSFRDCRILQQLPATGGEADIFLIGREANEAILKLYRYGIDPKEEVLRKAKDLSSKFPEHIVRIDEFGYDEKTKRWYEIQEYAKHGSLKDIASDTDSIKLKKILTEIVEGLKVLNDNNLLHLDLKPSNILVRTLEPLDLIFTDFGIASILDPELSKKMTKIKGTPMYWSPEAFTGVVGKEADYWSLGMIILEILLRRHPFVGLDTKVIMYTLSTKGVEITDDISQEYSLLLKGLLTREPEKRWDYDQVKKWLGGEREIPVYYMQEGHKQRNYTQPYKFHDKEYSSLEDLVAAFIESKESWRDALAHINRGYITKWLENNEDYDSSVQLEKIREESATDPDLVLLRMVYTFNKSVPFIVYGQLITVKNIQLYVGREVRKENARAEGLIVMNLFSGKLIEYYKVYLSAVSRDMDELYNILASIYKATSPIKEHSAKLTLTYKILETLESLDRYLLPEDIFEEHNKIVTFIVEHLDLLMTKEEHDDLCDRYIIPENIKSALLSNQSSQYIEMIKLLLSLHKDNQMLTKDEYKSLMNDYIIPAEIDSGLTSDSASSYCEKIKSLRLLQKNGILLGRGEYASLINNAIIPAEISSGVEGKTSAEYGDAVRGLRGLQKEDLLLKKVEYEEAVSDCVLPADLDNGLRSENTSEYGQAVKAFKALQKNNLLIKKKEYDTLVNDFFFPEEIKEGIYNSVTSIYERAANRLRRLQENKLLLSLDDYKKALESYLIPKELNDGLTSNEIEKYEGAVNLLKEGQLYSSLLTKNEYREVISNYIIPEDLKKGLNNSQIHIYKIAVKLYREMKDKNHLIKKDEFELLRKKYVIPHEITVGLMSVNTSEYGKAAGYLRAYQNDNSLKGRFWIFKRLAIILAILFVSLIIVIAAAIYGQKKIYLGYEKARESMSQKQYEMAIQEINNLDGTRAFIKLVTKFLFLGEANYKKFSEKVNVYSYVDDNELDQVKLEIVNTMLIGEWSFVYDKLLHENKKYFLGGRLIIQKGDSDGMYSCEMSMTDSRGNAATSRSDFRLNIDSKSITADIDINIGFYDKHIAGGPLKLGGPFGGSFKLGIKTLQLNILTNGLSGRPKEGLIVAGGKEPLEIVFNFKKEK